MNDGQLVKPLHPLPWTPSLEQSRFESINAVFSGSADDLEYKAGLLDQEQQTYDQSPPQSEIEKQIPQGHKRYLSFPLSTLETKQLTSLNYSNAVASPFPHQGLGIMFPPDCMSAPCAFDANDGASPSSPLSDMEFPIKEEEFNCQDDVINSSPDNDELEEFKATRTLTAAELRAERRKMKRFRLTHQQTRYLMSEFARHAHPDAAHRERLARQIPGLSSRQVQVWFQNRRAKLKRVTQDDREHIVQSRALPDNFDMTQALRSPFGEPHHSMPVTGGPDIFQSHIRKDSAIESRNANDLERSCTQLSFASISSLGGNPLFTPPQSAHVQFSSYQSTGYCSPFDTPPLARGEFALENPTDCIQSPAACSTSSQIVDSEGMASAIAGTFGASSPVTNQGIMSPRTQAYGLGFSFSSIPGFQVTSNLSVRNLSRLPGKVVIPPKSFAHDARAIYTPCISSIASRLSPATPYTMLSAPPGVTSFPQYTQ